MGATIVEVRDGDAARLGERDALRPRARRPAVLGPGHARRAAGRALAQAAGATRRGWPRIQAAILRAGARALRPGGTLVYSTCTISPAENEHVVRRSWPTGRSSSSSRRGRRASDLPVWDHPTRAPHLQTLPHRDGTDGFFVARLRRGAA